MLNAPYAGFTDAYTHAERDARREVRRGQGDGQPARASNLTNEKIQQHIFGDILKRIVVAELRFFAK